MSVKRFFSCLIVLLALATVSPNLLQAQGRTWDVTTGSVILNRDASYENGFIEDGGGNVIIGDAQFDNDFVGGVDVQGNLYLNQLTGINSRFFCVDDWSESAAAISGGGGSFISRSAVAGNGLYDNVFSTYNSSLYSAEVSLTRQYNDWLRVMGGFRWLQVEEMSHTDFFAGAVDSADYDGTVENNLYGGQLGLDTLIMEKRRARINGLFKAGVYGADIQTRGGFDNGGPPILLSDQDSDVAFVGEINVICNVRLTNNITAGAGWMFLWVDGIGVLSDQYDDVNWITGRGIDSDGDAYYQGGMVNLTISR